MLKPTLTLFAEAHGLSAREAGILEELLKHETSVKDIALALGLSPNTVSNHFKRIFEKSHTSSRSELLTAFIEFIFKNTPDCPRFHRQIVVAIIDDEQELCELIAEFFKRKGFVVHAYSDPNLAVQELPVVRPDAVITDIIMPQVSGLEILWRVREYHPYTPAVVFMTGGTPPSPVDVMSQGAMGILEKPLNLDAMYRMLLRSILHYREERAGHASTRAWGDDAITLKAPLRLRRPQVGHGGVFVTLRELIDAGLKDPAELKTDQLLSLQIEVEGLPPIQACGQIAWIRPKADAAKAAGAGVVFVDVSDDHREHLMRFAREHNVKSFVPAGVIS